MSGSVAILLNHLIDASGMTGMSTILSRSRFKKSPSWACKIFSLLPRNRNTRARKYQPRTDKAAIRGSGYHAKCTVRLQNASVQRNHCNGNGAATDTEGKLFWGRRLLDFKLPTTANRDADNTWARLVRWWHCSSSRQSACTNSYSGRWCWRWWCSYYTRGASIHVQVRHGYFSLIFSVTFQLQ